MTDEILEELISLQTGDPQNPTKLGFQDMFGIIGAGVGSSVITVKLLWISRKRI